jgi:hypothetical protein
MTIFGASGRRHKLPLCRFCSGPHESKSKRQNDGRNAKMEHCVGKHLGQAAS